MYFPIHPTERCYLISRYLISTFPVFGNYWCFLYTLIYDQLHFLCFPCATEKIILYIILHCLIYININFSGCFWFFFLSFIFLSCHVQGVKLDLFCTDSDAISIYITHSFHFIYIGGCWVIWYILFYIFMVNFYFLIF